MGLDLWYDKIGRKGREESLKRIRTDQGLSYGIRPAVCGMIQSAKKAGTEQKSKKKRWLRVGWGGFVALKKGPGCGMIRLTEKGKACARKEQRENSFVTSVTMQQV